MYPNNIPPDRMILIQEEPRGPSMLIEIPVIAAVSTVTLPIVQQLQTAPDQNIIIKGLRLVTFPELALSPTLGNANAPLAELQKMSLILYCEGWEKGQLIPILALNNTFTEASGIPYRDRSTKFNNWKNVDWNKSKIIYSNGSVAAGFPYDVLLEAEYVRFDKAGREIIGPSS